MTADRTMRRKLAGALAGALCALILTRAAASVPPQRYTHEDGIVRDNATDLTWRSEVEDDTYTQADAIARCQDSTEAGGGWRLPTVKELLTLVDTTVASPSIDGLAFPSTPAELFWTTTPHALTGDSMGWTVDFQYGGAQARDAVVPFRARCVRWSD